MKSLTLFSITIFALTIGCDNAPAQNEGYGNYKISQAVPVQNQDNNGNQTPAQLDEYTQAPQTQNNGGNELTMHTIIDKKTGKPSVYVPFPTSWKYIEEAQYGQPSVKGPNGLTITSFEARNFVYMNDATTNQYLQAYDGNVMAPIGVEAVISQQIIPQGAQMGMTLQNPYALLEIAAKNAEYASKLYSTSARQNIFKAVGIEGVDRGGNGVLVLVQYNELRTSDGVNWFYQAEILKANPNYFEQAKNQYIYGLSNRVFDQEALNAFNNQQAAQAASFQKNQEIIRKGEADRSKIRTETNEYLRNLDKASNEQRKHNENVVQEQMSNHLNDVNVVVSPYDGKEYQVETGSKIYWINNEGKYYQTDDLFFDPNNNASQPGVWKKAPIKEYK